MHRLIIYSLFILTFQNIQGQDWVLKPNSSTIQRVKFHQTLSESQYELFKEKGIHFLEYIGKHSYVLDDPHQVLKDYKSLILNMSYIEPTEKFIRFSPSKYRNRYENFTMKIYNSRKISELNSILSHYKVLNIDSIANTISVRANEAEILKLVEHNSVQYIEADDMISTPDGLLDLGNKRSSSISLSANYGMQYNGTGVHVGIQDDGNVNDHVDFHNRILRNVNDNNGAHADLCTGTIAAAGNRDPLGMGAAWGCNLHVFKQVGYPLFANSTIAQLYTDDSIYITSTSYSDGCNKGYVTQSANIDAQIRSHTSLMHVISAGNDGNKNCGYGAGNNWGTITGGHKTAKNCLTVGSINSYDDLSSFSSRGPAKDGRLKPEVCADGEQIYTTGNRDNYNLAKGTSQSTPAVAGALAQLYQAYKSKTGNNAHSALIKAALMNGCEDLHNNGPDFRTGYGRINVWRSWRMIDNNTYFNGSIAQGDSNIHTITLPVNTKSLRVLMYYHDREASLNASKDLVNDLNMRVVHPSGTLYPWVLNHTPNPATIDNPAVRGIDSMNNHEQVTLNNPPSGSYQIIVKGHDIPMGNQPYVVIYEVQLDEVRLIFPAGGEALAPNSEHTFRWDASHNTGSFHLEISNSTGTSWTTIDNNIPGDKRWYNFTIPAGAAYSGLYKCRISRNGVADTSNNFSIIHRPENIRLDWVCADSARFSWDTVAGVSQYKVYKLGTKYMDSLSVTGNSFFVAKNLNPNNEDWFSAQSIGANNALSRRGYAVEKERGMFNCASQVDVKLAAVLSPEGSISSCIKRDSLKLVLKIINNGMTINSLPVFYYLNKNPLASDTINQTISINSENIVTLTKTIAAKTTGIDSMMIYLAHPSDAYRANDTLLFLWNNISASNQAIPFVEEFDSYADADTAFDCNTDHLMPAPWYNDINSAQDDMDWRIRSGATPSPESGPNGDTTSATANGKYAFVQSGNCEDFVAKLNLGCINLDTAKNPYITYFYSMNGNNMGEHRVEIFGNGKWNFDTVNRKAGYQGTAWKKHQIDLTPYKGQKIMLRWTAKVKGELGSDIAIDRISIRDSIYKDTITLNRNPMAGGTVNGNGVYNRNSSVTVSATPNANYIFINWTENGNLVSTNASYTFTISSNRTLVANFAQIIDTLLTSANPSIGGNTSGGGTYTRGSNATVTATANAGYIFTNWTENGNPVSSNTSYTFAISANRNLVANFSQNIVNYTVTTASSPSNGGTTTGGGSYANGTSVTINATANVGYTFANWSENGTIVSTNASYSFIISANRNLVANFIQNVVNYSVSINASPSQGGTMSGMGSYNSGTTVTINAIPNAGYTFSNWTENGTIVSSNASYSFVINSSRAFVANFRANTNSISQIGVSALDIYPNPAHSFVQVNSHSPIKSIVILDILGKKLKETSIDNNVLKQSIDISDLIAGIYLIHIKTKDGSYTDKLLIER